MAIDFCLDAVDEAIARHGTRDIFNIDVGSPPDHQLASAAILNVLETRERQR